MNIEADKFGKGCRASEARITQRFEMVPLERLKPNSMNPREHSKKQINALKRAHRNNIELGVHGRHRSNVLQYPGMNSMTKGRGKALELHSTVKPVALISDLILDVSDRTDLVLDPFGGSGTTIIAAEAVGRKACLCEIEPAFVDVGVRRWQALTSGEARLAATGQTFAEVEAERLGAKEVNND